jgi:hypothetical protein
MCLPLSYNLTDNYSEPSDRPSVGGAPDRSYVTRTVVGLGGGRVGGGVGQRDKLRGKLSKTLMPVCGAPEPIMGVEKDLLSIV